MLNVVVSPEELFFGIHITMEQSIEETQVCDTCNIEKSILKFEADTRPTGTYRRKKCKDCRRESSKRVDELYKIHGHKKPEHCEKCGEKAKLVLDHDHETHEFRGWLCNYCNLGIAWLGDTKEGLQDGIEYFEMVEKRQKESTYI